MRHWTCGRTPTSPLAASRSRPSSTRAAAPWRPCSSSPAACARATPWSAAPPTVVCVRCSTRTASRSTRRVRPVPSAVPRAGDSVISTEDDRTARQIAEKRDAIERNAAQARGRKRISLEDFTKALAEGKVDMLNLILKGDVSGAVEALEDSLLKIDVGDEVDLRIIHRGVGAITENDINLATVDNAIVIGFNVRPEAKARDLADREGVDVRYYSVIYQAIDDIESSL